MTPSFAQTRTDSVGHDRVTLERLRHAGGSWGENHAIPAKRAREVPVPEPLLHARRVEDMAAGEAVYHGVRRKFRQADGTFLLMMV